MLKETNKFHTHFSVFKGCNVRIKNDENLFLKPYKNTDSHAYMQTNIVQEPVVKINIKKL